MATKGFQNGIELFQQIPRDLGEQDGVVITVARQVADGIYLEAEIVVPCPRFTYRRFRDIDAGEPSPRFLGDQMREAPQPRSALDQCADAKPPNVEYRSPTRVGFLG